METTIASKERKLSPRSNLLGGGMLFAEVILLILAAVGIAAWIYQLSTGLIVTHMTNMVVWGLYITLFMFLVGLSAGGLIVASSGEVFGAKHLKPLAPLAIWLSFICIGLAAISIIPDLGSPQRIWRLFINGQWTSPFVWDLTIILFYLVLSGIYLWLHIRADAGGEQAQRFERWVRRVAYIALPAAILVHSITAWIFGLQVARSYWHSALLAPFFISSALVSGLGLVILATLLARRVKKVEISNNLVSWLGGLLATFIAVDFFFLLAEMITRLYPAAEGADAALVLLTGRLAPLFWTEVILGLVVPFVLLAVGSWRKSMPVVGLAAFLAIVGIFLKRFNLLMTAFTYPYEHLPEGIQTGQNLLHGTEVVQVASNGAHMASYVYSPALIEVLIVVGLISAGVLVFLLGAQLLPLGGARQPEV